MSLVLALLLVQTCKQNHLHIEQQMQSCSCFRCHGQVVKGPPGWAYCSNLIRVANLKNACGTTYVDSVLPALHIAVLFAKPLELMLHSLVCHSRPRLSTLCAALLNRQYLYCAACDKLPMTGSLPRPASSWPFACLLQLALTWS